MENSVVKQAGDYYWEGPSGNSSLGHDNNTPA